MSNESDTKPKKVKKERKAKEARQESENKVITANGTVYYKQGKSHLNWCFTINDCGDIVNDEEKKKEFGIFWQRVKDFYDDSVINYCKCSFEKGEENGHLHIQGFVQFHGNKKRLTWLKNHFHLTAHFGPMYEKSTPGFCKEYVSKLRSSLNVFFEIGNLRETRQGARNDIKGMFTVLDNNKTAPLESLYKENDVLVRYSRCAREYLTYERSKFRETAHRLVTLDKLDITKSEYCVICFYGRTGIGKSELAIKLADYFDLDRLRKTDGNQYLDKYYDQPCIIWEEFGNSSHKPDIGNLLVLTDRYRPFSYNARYSSAFIQNLKLLIFTSPYHPRNWYVTDENNQKALLRRFSHIIELSEAGKFVDDMLAARSACNSVAQRSDYSPSVAETEPKASTQPCA